MVCCVNTKSKDCRKSNFIVSRWHHYVFPIVLLGLKNDRVTSISKYGQQDNKRAHAQAYA